MPTLTWLSGPALYLAFSPDGKTLAAGGADEVLRLWDTPSGKLRATFRGHPDAIDWVAFSPDGRTIFTASRDTTIKLWDLSVREPSKNQGLADDRRSARSGQARIRETWERSTVAAQRNPRLRFGTYVESPA